MIYTIDEIKEKVAPVAKKYNLKAVYLFGSYARDEATDDSDVDLLIDRTGADTSGFFWIGGLYNDMQESVGKEIDIITTQSLNQSRTLRDFPLFSDSVKKESILIYE